jgi:ribosomal protein L1
LVEGKLPRGDQQIKKAYLKLTMSKPVVVAWQF